MSCSSTKRLSLNDIFIEKNTFERILIPNNALVNSYTIFHNNIEYKIGVYGSKIIYIGTNDNKFSVNGLKVGDMLPKDFFDRELRKIPGWAYCVEIDLGWYAGFNYNEKPDENTPITFFFQYDFNASTK